MANHLVRRGSTYFVRLTIPRERWADVGRALGAAGGLKREVVRTLQTGDYREATARRDAGLSALRELVDAALKRTGLRPLTDWTADWQGRAVQLGDATRSRADVVSRWVRGPDDEPIPIMESDLTVDTIEEEATLIEKRQGEDAARAFVKIATARELSVAQASQQWLASIKGTIREGTWRGYQASIALLGGYLAAHESMPTLEAVFLSDVTRPIAGEVIAWRRAERASETVQRDFSAWNGLWRWAVRRGYASLNPWTDQTAGMKAPRAGDEDETEKRAYTPAELVALLRAGADQLAPNGGGYGPALWDIVRLGLLTGCRVGELIGLRVGDVIADGAAIATQKRGKSDAASRIVPLHAFAQEVMQARLKTLEDCSPGASIWPEVAGATNAEKRAKTLSSRFVPVRRRILGEDDGTDMHSLRRAFMTAAETAHHAGGRVNPELIDLLVGHKRGRMSLDLYSEWSRMGRMVGTMDAKLATLRAAVDDTVALGLALEVRQALEQTRGDRPAVIRVRTAFSRSNRQAQVSPIVKPGRPAKPSGRPRPAT